jgi:peptidoglycan/xylan/chitin deacetylase (PgdA/CDA1 family)
MLAQRNVIMAAASMTALGLCAVRGTFAPTSSFWGKVVWRSPDRSQPWVSLTFDDGPTAGSTDRVLDLLRNRGVFATFFVIGRNAARWPELVRRMDAEGHIVANHTFDHGHFDLFRGWGYWRRQIARTNQLIEEIIGKRPAFFRPSMGFKTAPIHQAARGAGQTVVTWSRGARDGRSAQAAAILRRMTERVGPGDILMMHDGVDPCLRRQRDCDRSATISALGQLIDALQDRGLRTVRLDEFLSRPAYAGGGQDRSGPTHAQSAAGCNVGNG